MLVRTELNSRPPARQPDAQPTEPPAAEMLLKSGSLKVPPAPLAIGERKTELKLLGVTFEDDPVNWDSHIDHVLNFKSWSLTAETY